MVKITLHLLLTFLLIFTFTGIESTCLNIGLSWTVSKIIPYILLIVNGAIITYILSKMNFKKPLLKLICLLAGISLPFIVGFRLHPIYEGDFSNNGIEIKKNLSPTDFTQTGLTVITIPGCPYCFETISILKKIKKRNPSLKIDFVVCTPDVKNIKTYQKEINGSFQIRIADKPNELAAMAGFSFPAFVYSKNNTPITLWRNDTFGVTVIDDLENKTRSLKN